ncbi:putative hexose phosphate translocator [Vairimorpha necatrix]|uniref:Hexose phosphate translocator n=1 Tax=Vairimorpha necatrix TaxID=6039 RepID=A0AAX4J987_9MICR
MKKTIQIIGLITLYYFTSLGLGFFTKYFLSKTAYNFRFPLFKSSIQNLTHFILSSAIIKMNKDYAKDSKFMYYTIPCAITGALDIGLSSFSLRNVSLAFYTMVKSSAPVFILLSGMVFGIEQPSVQFFLIIFSIGLGVFMTSFKNSNFDFTGFGIISFASFMAGFRWAFIQYLLEKRGIKKGGMYGTIRDLSLPISFILCIMSYYYEGFYEIIQSEFFNNTRSAMKNLGFIIGIGIFSFLLICSEFTLVSKTSVVFLSISSIIKELVIIFISLFRKEIELNGVNYIGLGISILGILFYNIKRQKIR